MWKTRSNAEEYKVIERIGDRVADKAIAFTAVTAPVVLTMAVFAVMIDRTNKRDESSETQQTKEETTPPMKISINIITLPPVERVLRLLPNIPEDERIELKKIYATYKQTLQNDNIRKIFFYEPQVFFKALASAYSLKQSTDNNPGQRAQMLPDYDFVEHVETQIAILDALLTPPPDITDRFREFHYPTPPPTETPTGLSMRERALIWVGILQLWIKDPTYSPDIMPNLNEDQKRVRDELIQYIHDRPPPTGAFNELILAIPAQTPFLKHYGLSGWHMVYLVRMAQEFHRMDAIKKNQATPISAPVVRSDLHNRPRRATPTPTPSTNPANPPQ